MSPKSSATDQKLKTDPNEHQGQIPAQESERCKALENRLEVHLKHEEALRRCSTLLLSLAPVSETLKKVLGILLETVDAGRAYFYKPRHDPEGVPKQERACEILRPGSEPLIPNIANPSILFDSDKFESWLQQLESGKPVHELTSQCPSKTRKLLQDKGILATLLLPVMVTGRWHGFIGFDDTKRGQMFHEEELRLLAAVAEMIGGYLGMIQTQQELQERERKLSSLVDHMPVMIMALDDEERIVFWNKECERVTGFTSEEALNDPTVLDKISSTPGAHSPLIEQCRSAPNDYRNTELGLLGKDGAARVISWSNVNKQLKLPGWTSCCVGLNITERVRIEELVLRAKSEWERTFDSVPDIIVITDMDFTIRRLNQAAANRLNMHPREVVGRHLRYLLEEPKSHGEGDDTFRQIRFMAHSGQVEVREFPLRRLGGHFLVTICPYMLDDNQRVGAIFVAHDISHWKVLEEQLRQAQKMEALGTLAGGIAHDFNNILGAVMGYTEMLLDSGVDNGQQRMLKEIFKASERSRLLIQQILAFSRQDKQETRPLRLTPLIKETLQLLRASVTNNIAIRTQLLTEADTVAADPTQIHQIIMNLCVNASQAIGEKSGELEVSLVDSYLEDQGLPGFGSLPPGPYVRIGVRDTGPGIPPEILDRIFDPFFTTKKPGEGTGMGLSVVHGIVQKLGGAVTVDSTVGRGSTFHIFLPRLETSKGESHAFEGPLPLGSEQLLLVDDETALLDIGREMLEPLGYKVVTESSSKSALQLFKKNPEAFDLAVIDQAMPSMPGTELIAALKKIRPDLPVILCTGFSEALSFESAKESGVRRFLVKPVLKRELAQAIREVLNGKTSDQEKEV